MSVNDNRDRHSVIALLQRQPSEPRIYTKDDIEEMLAVAALLGIEFDEDSLSTDDPEKMSLEDAKAMADAIKNRIHDGWIKEKERQEKKAGRHGGQ